MKSLIFLVQDVMMIVGGKTEASFKDTTGYKKDIKLVLPDGSTCTDTSLPEFDVPHEGMGVASRKNRYIYRCGGIKRSPTSSMCIVIYEELYEVFIAINYFSVIDVTFFSISSSDNHNKYWKSSIRF